MEDTTMNNTNETVNAKEVAMAEKAKAFAEASKEKLVDGFKFIFENIDVAADEVTKMSNMNSEELEEYLKENSESIFGKIMGSVRDFSDRLKSKSGLFPSFAKHAETSDNIITLIKDVLDDNEINGWGKYPQIVEALRIWLLKILFSLYKKPSLGMFIGTLVIPFVAPGVMAYDAICTHLETSKQVAKLKSAENIDVQQNYKKIYRNHCWSCHDNITETNDQCSVCGWYICPSCGSCKKRLHESHSI